MARENPLDRLTKEKIVELLNRCWMTHDGMWYYHCFRDLGAEQANRLNRAAIRSLAPLETGRICQALGLPQERLESFEELKAFLNGAAPLVIPSFMGGRFFFPRLDVLRWEFPAGQCFAYKGIKRIGALEGYECGVIFRLQCWFEALGLKFSVNPPSGHCRMAFGEACSGEFLFDFDTKNQLSSFLLLC
jgi:hypothetical protein